MKYLSVDIETTGLDREKDLILEFGAIIEDTNNPLPYEELPKFHRYIRYGRYEGSAYALALNKGILDILAENKHPDITSLDRFPIHVGDWLQKYNLRFTKNNVAGKNFRDFDFEFLRHVPLWEMKYKRRFIDPAMLYWNPFIDDELPNQDLCLERAGINETVDHTALGDAWQVIQLIRKYYEQE